jgi:thiol:disulfide interchange protein
LRTRIEAALVKEVGGEAPPIPEAREIDWGVVETQLAAAESKGRDLLIEFTAPGCRACEAMETRVLAKDEVAKAMENYEVVTLGVEQDAYWALFEALGLSSTPAFVRIGPGRTLGNRIQGYAESDAFLRFLSP